MKKQTYQDFCTSKITQLDLMGQRINLQMTYNRDLDWWLHTIGMKWTPVHIPKDFEVSHLYGKSLEHYECKPALWISDSNNLSESHNIQLQKKHKEKGDMQTWYM